MSVARSGGFALAFATCFAIPAVAQPANGASTAQAPTTAPAATAPSRSGPSGTLEKTHDDWRSSTLVDATVYNDDGTSIGTIDNLLIGNDGKVSQAVLSVGGFLGLGSKLVSVPFDQLKFEHSRGMVVPAAPIGGTAGSPNGAAGAPGAVGTGPVNSAAAPGPSGTPAGRAAMSRPDYYSVVLPGATKDSLKSMQTFEYNR